MIKKQNECAVILAALLGLGTMTAGAQQAQPPAPALTEAGQKLEAGYAPLVPMPKSIAPGQGSMTLGSRVVASTPELRPLVEVAVEEILLLTGRKLSVAEGGGIQPGDVWLEITPGQKGASRRKQITSSHVFI